MRIHSCELLSHLFEKLPPLIDKINREKRNSKNYVLFLGETGVESNQTPCLSLVQFQIDNGELVLSAYQRSSDANLGLPADIYHLYLMARQMGLPSNTLAQKFKRLRKALALSDMRLWLFVITFIFKI